jgi:hypothetical protein
MKSLLEKLMFGLGTLLIFVAGMMVAFKDRTGGTGRGHGSPQMTRKKKILR